MKDSSLPIPPALGVLTPALALPFIDKQCGQPYSSLLLFLQWWGLSGLHLPSQ